MSFSILSDREIAALCQGERPMIEPFIPYQAGKPSWGLGSFGYDIRLGKKFLVPLGGVNAVLDPVDFPRGHFREIQAEEVFELAPHSQVLAESVETFNMPEDVMGVCWGKSSYARCGLLVNVTPLECFDDQTEILTLDGWKKFEDLVPGEIVATLNKDGVLEYHPITARQKRWYEGEMICIKGRSIDLLVTPEHQPALHTPAGEVRFRIASSWRSGGLLRTRIQKRCVLARGESGALRAFSPAC